MADKKRRIATVEDDRLQKRTGTGSSNKDNDEGDDNDDDDDDEEDDEDDDDVTNIYCNLSEHDQAILLCVLRYKCITSSGVDTDRFCVRLSRIRQLCGMESRTEEEDRRSVRSMADKGDVLTRDKCGRVEVSSLEIRARITKEFADSVRTDGGYLMLCTIMDYSWFSHKAEGLKTRIIHDIIQPFVWSKGLDIVDLMVMHGVHFDGFFGCDIIDKLLKLPSAAYYICENEQEKWNGFKEFVQHNMESCQKSIDELNLASLLGSYLIGLGTGNEKDMYGLSLSTTKWSMLINILISEAYTVSSNSSWKEKTQTLGDAFPVLQNNSTVDETDVIKELIETDKVLTYQGEDRAVGFVSDDVRHQVMSYFVLNCLNTVEDYKNYIRLSSVDSLLEYVHTWWHRRDKRERCMYLPEELEESFIKKLGIDAIRHVMVEDRVDSDRIGSRERENCVLDKVKKILNQVPEEIFDWDYEARCRYVECAKRGTQTIHRARLMIVGCAGAGKTTLLRRLQGKGLEELKRVESTVGLEVHEDLFEITDNGSLRALSKDSDKTDKRILSVVDFGGQCAYYACHQVYLSRRAFYLLVLDMSKSFNERVDENLCEQNGTMFADWTYGGYVVFWLKSIHTYCGEDAAVIVVATHSENMNEREKSEFFDRLLDLLPADDANLKKHFHPNRCFFIGLPVDEKSCLDPLSDLEKCIASIAKENRWRESIPKEWSIIELIFIKLKERANDEPVDLMIPVKEIQKKYWQDSVDTHMKVEDALRFFNDIGLILFFNEKELSKSVIIDVQRFVDSFKFIISDKKHVRYLAETDMDWRYFNRTGYLRKNLLDRIWKDIAIRWEDEELILQYMERLGLLAIGDEKHYVPCMNKRDFGRKEKVALRGMETKSSVLVLHFQFLPYFFFCRLIVACIVGMEWKVVEDDGIPCLYKDFAVFIYNDHFIALVVTMSAIQVQIFRPQNATIDPDISTNIKSTLEHRLGYLTSTFHKKVTYRIAFQCSGQDVLSPDMDRYVYDEELPKEGHMMCPRHGFTESHQVNVEALTRFWKLSAVSISTQAKSKKALPSNQTREEILRKFKDWLQLQYKDVKIIHAYIGSKMHGKYSVLFHEDAIVAVIDNVDVIQHKTFEDSGKTFQIVCKLWRYPSSEGVIVSNREKEREIPEEKQMQLEKCLKRNSNDLFKRHCNLEIISVSAFRSKNNGEELVFDPCIVLYCSCKLVLPWSEEEFPKEIDGIKTDIREGFFYLFPNDQFFKRSTDLLNPLMIGSNIGREGQNKEGTLGGFVTLNNGEIGAITCSHLFFDINSTSASMPAFNVVQPSYGYKNTNEICGRHEQSVSPFHTARSVTLDVSLIKLINRIPQRGLFADLKANDLADLGFTHNKLPEYSKGGTRDYRKEHRNRMNACIKCGTASGLSKGSLRLNGLAARCRDITFSLTNPPSQAQCTYLSQLEVEGTPHKPFSVAGDSGALVFQVDPPSTKDGDDELVCIGMVVGGTSYYTTVVTPIQPILEALNVKMHVFPQEEMDVS